MLWTSLFLICWNGLLLLSHLNLLLSLLNLPLIQCLCILFCCVGCGRLLLVVELLLHINNILPIEGLILIILCWSFTALGQRWILLMLICQVLNFTAVTIKWLLELLINLILLKVLHLNLLKLILKNYLYLDYKVVKT